MKLLTNFLIIGTCLGLVSCGYPSLPEEHISFDLDVTSKAHDPKQNGTAD